MLGIFALTIALGVALALLGVVSPMAKYVEGKPITMRYTPTTTVNAGDVIVVGNRPFVATQDNPESTLQGTPVVTYQVMELAVSGGIFLMQADAAYPNGTYVYWNPTSQQVTASPTAGGSCVAFGWLVGGPGFQISDGGPTGAASQCYVELDPTDDSGQILGAGAAASDIVTNTASETIFATIVTIPAGTLVAGDTIHIRASGVVTGQNSTNTNNLKLKILTAANTNTALLTSGAINAGANTGFILDGDVVFTSVGNSGAFNFTGDYGVAGTARTVAGSINTAINTNLAIVISVTDTQSAASTSNTTQLAELVVQKIRR
jgi:predicted RecA/RadA family phage recombinase